MNPAPQRIGHTLTAGRACVAYALCLWRDARGQKQMGHDKMGDVI